MLALQTMQVPDHTLNDITNSPGTPTPVRPNTTYDFSSQLLNLTAIANNLQKEMAQLSRRSKDNATDLISLKDATSKRDEDIRKSLRELTTGITLNSGLLGPIPPPGAISRSASSFGNYLDNKPFGTPPSQLPRAASANGFFEERSSSPSPYSVEGAASVAMLEKIIREMVTKEGQERLQSSLSELLQKNHKENSQAAQKMEELSDFIKEKSQSHALVPFSGSTPPKLNTTFDSPGAKTRDAGGREAMMIGSEEEINKMLQRVKDSITHVGGTSSEVKNLVRDLRAEVLGMGREIGRKLDTAGESQLKPSLDRSISGAQGGVDSGEMQSIIEDAVAELKEHLAATLKDHVDSNDNAFKQIATRSAPNNDDMLAVVKHALAEHGVGIATRDFAAETSNVDRESILDAVKEGLKDFEPNIELQQFGLERDEILAVLKEGLEGHQRDNSGAASTGISKVEVYEAITEALKDFRPPLPEDQVDQIKKGMLEHMRQALLEYMPSSAGTGSTDLATRAAIVEAVKEAVASHGSNAPRELEISREDLFAAVKASLDGSSIPFGGLGEQVLMQLNELFDGMRDEFKEYTAANGRDTEQVLDAVKDGLETLRSGIESYVDRAQDVTGKDEIVNTVNAGLEQLRADVQMYISQGSSHANETPELLDHIRLEFENLHGAISTLDSAGAKRERGYGDGELLEGLRAEIDKLKGTILNTIASDKSELIETIQDSMGALHARANNSQLSGEPGGVVEEIINEMHLEFNQLKETFQSVIEDADRDAIVTSIRSSIEDLRVQLSGDHSDTFSEALTAIREELERFRAQVGVSNSTSRGLDDDASTITPELLEALRGEFENLRSSIANGSVAGSQVEEVLDEVRVGLDDLRNHLDKKLDNPEQATQQHGDFLDAINEGIETLRSDIVKTLDKPVDMTVNYEILDTLKDGLSSLRADIEKLKSSSGVPTANRSSEIILADDATVGQARDLDTGAHTATTADAPSPVPRADLGKIEVLLSQLQIKMGALEATMNDLPSMQASSSTHGSATKDDIIALEVFLKEIQDGVTSMGTRGGGPTGEDFAKKEDTDAIETLLRNTKGQLEDMAYPDPATVVTKEHLDAVEAVVRLTNGGIESLADRLENTTAAKADVAVVEILAQDVKAALEEVKDRLNKDDQPDVVTRADLDVLGVMVTEIKTRISGMIIPDPDELPSKADVEQLHGLINDFRESHDKMREGYDKDIEITAKAFDDRRQEFNDTVEQISNVKKSLADLKDDLLAKMGEGDCSLDDLGSLMKVCDEKLSPINTGLTGLVEKVSVEFDRTNASLNLLKIEQLSLIESSSEKQTEHKDTVIRELGEKFETYFDGLMSKYEDAQRAAEDKARSVDERAGQQEEALTSMKVMAEELRLSIDTLGSTLTSFPDTMDKMASESATMFNRVDDTYNKLDETQEGLKYEHTVTREEISKVLAAIGGLSSETSDHNPRFLTALSQVQSLVGQHYEHSQRASDAAAEHAKAVKDLQEQIRGIGAQNDELKSNVSALPRLMPATASDSASATEQYDDRAVHEKLDKLMGHAAEASNGDASAQLERLNQIHEKVMATAADVSAFVAVQTRQLTEVHESKERDAEELALLLERRLVQKDELEADITVLNEEQESLQAVVETLKAEKEALGTQKSRLTAEVSSLETAMRIRREELHEMDLKAEAIERRMLEGVMNQSRMLLLAKTGKSPPKKKSQGRDLRIPSTGSATSAQTVTSSLPSLKASHALAMRSRPGMQRNAPAASSAERRIMSLNQINHNIPTGGSAFSPAPSLIHGAPLSVKRSHSVKTPADRKATWAGQRSLGLAEYNKENAALSEISEDELQRPDSRGIQGDTGAASSDLVRKTSNTADARSAYTYTDADGSVADSTSLTADDASRYSFGTGSYLAGSEITDHRASIGSSATGRMSRTSVIIEDPEEEFHESNDAEMSEEEEEDAEAVGGAQQEQAMQIAVPPSKLEMAMYAPPSDSGLGTDAPPTAATASQVGSGYFS